jgi:hypothetical protein
MQVHVFGARHERPPFGEPQARGFWAASAVSDRATSDGGEARLPRIAGSGYTPRHGRSFGGARRRGVCFGGWGAQRGRPLD